MTNISFRWPIIGDDDYGDASFPLCRIRSRSWFIIEVFLFSLGCYRFFAMSKRRPNWLFSRCHKRWFIVVESSAKRRLQNRLFSQSELRTSPFDKDGYLAKSVGLGWTLSYCEAKKTCSSEHNRCTEHKSDIIARPATLTIIDLLEYSRRTK